MSQFVRNCPVCNLELSYAVEQNFKLASRKESLCRSCVQKGKKTSEQRSSIRMNRTNSSKVPASTIHPSNNELFWAAGFLDGEGCFIGTGSEMVEASQVDIWPLEKLQAMFGGTIKHRSGNGKRQDYHLWRIWGARALGVQLTLFSLLSPRRQNQILTANYRCRQ